MTNETRSGSWFLTHSGVKFYPLDPQPSEVRLEDIAHHLSNLCRFLGGTRQFYSVAQHSILVADAVGRECGPVGALFGLLHDAAEAYLHDIVRPIKRDLYFRIADQFVPYKDIERQCQAVILDGLGLLDRFGYPSDGVAECIKRVDDVICLTEGEDMLTGVNSAEWGFTVEASDEFRPFEQMDPATAEDLFLDTYAVLLRRALA